VSQKLSYRAQEFVRRLWTKGYEDDVFFMAGAVAFNLLLALIPLLLLGGGLAGYAASGSFGNPGSPVPELISDFLPGAAGGVDVTTYVSDLVARLAEQRGGLTVVGSVFFILIATRLVGSLRTALREIFDVAETRGILEGKLFDTQVVVLGLVLLTLNLGLTVFLAGAVRTGVSVMGLDGPFLDATDRLAAHGLAFASIWILFLVVYRYLPARRIPWKTVLIAATFSAVSHELLKAGFSWYAREVANYTSTFGNLATVAVLVFWIYYEAVVFILGGEIGQVYTMRKAARLNVRADFGGSG